MPPCVVPRQTHYINCLEQQPQSGTLSNQMFIIVHETWYTEVISAILSAVAICTITTDHYPVKMMIPMVFTVYQ